MNTVLTKDSSYTLYSEVHNEHYHSLTGAAEEAREKYAKALRVWEREAPVIYDVCFGLGYNAAAAIDEIRSHGNPSKVTVVCFENDLEVLKMIPLLDAPFSSYDVIREFIAGFLERDEYQLERDSVHLIMMHGDFREMIEKLNTKADYVFFDPFSPNKQPELWTQQVFSSINEAMKNGASLATYSYARKPSENMALAGFAVGDGPIVRRWCPGTICFKPAQNSSKKDL